MKGKHTIYFDQYGNKFAATTVAGLRKQIGGGGAGVDRMFRDGVDGVTYHVGYVIGGHWLTAYQPVRVAV
jgi:hypothetical protein